MKKFTYHNTDIEIRLGDFITFRSLITLWFPKPGRVFYMLGQSPPHSEMKTDDNVDHWAIRLENGRIISWLYLPEELSPSRSVTFVSRGEENYNGMQPDLELL